MKHTLIIIGWMGSKTCYLDVSKEEAIERYCKENNESLGNFKNFSIPLESFEITDKFWVYDIWANS